VKLSKKTFCDSGHSLFNNTNLSGEPERGETGSRDRERERAEGQTDRKLGS
jgi:hypothetical protein